jgi:hypothetical protein
VGVFFGIISRFCPASRCPQHDHAARTLAQHIFIPVLPETLLDYLSAPMPFLVGVHSSLAPKINGLNLEEVVYCDLDR